ncbi:MAG: hypothetical protein QM662_06265 [Gordonia sp. (in: high G+C Gram-positive bacteria)]
MNPSHSTYRGSIIAADELIAVLIESGLAAPAAQRMRVADVLDAIAESMALSQSEPADPDVFPVAVAW